jgi:alpha-glucosidase (family GH31 glycosyl hydrolase)
MRNLYPNEYIESYYKFINKNNSGEKICFSRAGYTGAQRFPAHWAGDEHSTFEAFRKSIIAGLTAGMSGISFWGWDIAGFSGEIPTAELYIRASQMAAFCPIMQYHAESKAEFNQDRTPWNIAERTGDMRVIEIYRNYAQLRMNLLPYIYNEALKSSNSGIPMMRTLFMEYPDDINCAGIEDEYMFGDALLVCPVIREGAVKREVYLPEGKWMDFYDNRIYEGGRKIEADAPIDMIPVYVKKNSIIAFNLNENYMVPGKVPVGLDEYDNLCFIINIGQKIHPEL